MIRLLLITLILLSGCDKQGEDMTIFPFLEVDTTAATTNAVNPYKPYVWDEHDFSRYTECSYKDEIYSIDKSHSKAFNPYLNMVMKKGSTFIYKEHEYEVTNDIDRTVNNKDIVRVLYDQILQNIDAHTTFGYAYTLISSVVERTNRSVTVAKNDNTGFILKDVKVITRAGDRLEESLIFESPSVNSDGIKHYEVKILQEHIDGGNNLTSTNTLNRGYAALYFGYADFMLDHTFYYTPAGLKVYTKPPAYKALDAYIFIDNVLYRARRSQSVGFIPPDGASRESGLPKEYKVINNIVTRASVLPKFMPFDDKGHTVASANGGHLYYDNIVATDGGEFSTVALYGIVADRYKVTFDNGEVHESTIPLTEAGITRFIKADSTTSHCRIDLYRADGGKVSIGGIGISRESIDMGGTKFSADGTMNDNSPYETRKGGVVDYRPGITTFKDGVTTIIPIANAQTLENLRTTIKTIKRRRLAFDIGDAWHQKDDINVAMQVVARAESISYNLRSGDKDEPPEYIEVRWKIGESS